jgi:hypothetical protein
MFVGHSMFSLRRSGWKIRNPFHGTNSMMIETDYSIYTLSQLFKARYWMATRGRSLEDEIQKRCAHIRERTNGKPFAGAESSSRFRPYGFMLGTVFLLFSVGPFAAVKFLDMINVINDVSGDKAGLSGVWALLMLPVIVIVVMIGGLMDAERIVKWFNLAGRS